MLKTGGLRRKGGGRRSGSMLRHDRNIEASIGDCVCVKCGYTVKKEPGVPCMKVKCPVCGSVLLRKGGRHYNDAKRI
jgi:hypothetical protein